MKNLLMGLALVATLTSVSFAGGVKKEKKAAKAKTEAKCDKEASGHGCCMKKMQA